MKKNNLKKLVSKLPKHPNVLGRDRFFNSAVLIPLVKIDGEYHLIFQKRAAHIRQGGDICFPGGGFESDVDKDFKDTALRETYEELGIPKKDIKILGQLDTYVAPIGAIIESFVARVKKKAYNNMKIDHNEVEKTIVIPISFFKDNEPKEYTLAHEIQPYKIDENGNKEIFFPVEELGLPDTYKKPWGNKRHKIWVYEYEGEVIWGITSVLIKDVIDKY
ncbi:MAG: CoA pyrophosphatase [Arcobacter sp.]|jgi:8-oxo-dGTP pyrophosphatase MutT (NUDIX family)|uniref:Coenzyme A pyrophosphatase n=1 Tax=Arcobacter defluvii TaxID=873191 RepID=A0AAE7BF76_9BACT|nr:MULTISPECIES: CoA pyrophosphatase [Arcobacter]MDY3199978.1 CoA pyrophosphatase [Arcobacter sp.]QKF78191.1 coenzyme A pyrophosphatase [Arcobacter defluvii]RXI33296.1 CoA pyrophosphatase [Arcobacter defluvii]BAK74008.1 phosphohydrolase [Arcobacter sp. L]